MRKISGGVDADASIVAANPGTTSIADSSEDEPNPHPEVEISLSGSTCGRFGRSLSRSTLAILEAEESTALVLENLSSSM